MTAPTQRKQMTETIEAALEVTFGMPDAPRAEMIANDLVSKSLTPEATAIDAPEAARRWLNRAIQGTVADDMSLSHVAALTGNEILTLHERLEPHDFRGPDHADRDEVIASERLGQLAEWAEHLDDTRGLALMPVREVVRTIRDIAGDGE